MVHTPLKGQTLHSMEKLKMPPRTCRRGLDILFVNLVLAFILLP